MSDLAGMSCARCGALLTMRPRAPLCPACLLTTALTIDGDVDRGTGDPALDLPYDIVTILARGDRSVTYLAQPRGSSRRVSLAIAGPCDVGGILSRFARWKHALEEARHPHSSQLLDVGASADDCVYVASEYVAGAPLDAAIRRGTLTEGQRTHVMRQIADALVAAHEHGVAHMKLDATRIKIASGCETQAVLLGLGMRLVVDGDEADLARDVGSLVRLGHDLGVNLRPAYVSAAAVRADLAGGI